MGFYVFTVIALPVTQDGRPEEFRQIALKHLERLEGNRKQPLSMHFLRAVHQGRCVQCSDKGEGLSYAAVGNYTDIEGLVEDLLPYFDELWAKDFILDFERVVMFTNAEDKDATDVAEIRAHPGLTKPSVLRYTEFTDDTTKASRVTYHERQKFYWGQM